MRDRRYILWSALPCWFGLVQIVLFIKQAHTGCQAWLTRSRRGTPIMVTLPTLALTHGNGLPISDCILSWRTPLWATPDSLLNNADAPLKLLLVCTLAWFHGITVEPSTFYTLHRILSASRMHWSKADARPGATLQNPSQAKTRQDSWIVTRSERRTD